MSGDEAKLLLTHAYKGDLDQVKVLIADGVSPNAKNGYGHTALMYAAKRGHVGVVRFLVDECHADPAMVDHQGASALTMAVNSGNTEVIDFLVHACNANPHHSKKGLEEAAVCAVRSRDMAALRALLEAGADANAADAHGDTPITVGAANGDLECVQWLVEHAFASVNAPANDRTAMMCAARNGEVELVRWLRANTNADMFFKNKSGDTALHEALRGGHINCVVALLEPLRSCNEQHADTPAHLAIPGAPSHVAREDCMAMFQAALAVVMDAHAAPIQDEGRQGFVVFEEWAVGQWFAALLSYFDERSPSAWSDTEKEVLELLLTTGRGVISLEYLEREHDAAQLEHEFSNATNEQYALFLAANKDIRQEVDFEAYRRSAAIIKTQIKSSFRQMPGTISQLHAHASRIAPNFHRVVEGVSRRAMGCVSHSVHFKPLFSSLLKACTAVSEQGGVGTDTLVDVVNGLLEFRSLTQLLVALDVLVGLATNIDGGTHWRDEDKEPITITTIDNRFVGSLEGRGWSDCVLHLTLPASPVPNFVCELQLTVSSIVQTRNSTDAEALWARAKAIRRVLQRQGKTPRFTSQRVAQHTPTLGRVFSPRGSEEEEDDDEGEGVEEGEEEEEGEDGDEEKEEGERSKTPGFGPPNGVSRVQGGDERQAREREGEGEREGVEGESKSSGYSSEEDETPEQPHQKQETTKRPGAKARGGSHNKGRDRVDKDVGRHMQAVFAHQRAELDRRDRQLREREVELESKLVELQAADNMRERRLKHLEDTERERAVRERRWEERVQALEDQRAADRNVLAVLQQRLRDFEAMWGGPFADDASIV